MIVREPRCEEAGGAKASRASSIHIEGSRLPGVDDIRVIMGQFWLTNHVVAPTRQERGWLDVVLTRNNYTPIDLGIYSPTASDHSHIIASIPFLCETPSYFVRLVSDWLSFRSGQLDIPAASDPSFLGGPTFADNATYTGLVFPNPTPDQSPTISLYPWGEWATMLEIITLNNNPLSTQNFSFLISSAHLKAMLQRP